MNNPVFDAVLTSILSILAVSHTGLVALFIVAFISATLVPMGSEPALLGLIHLNPALLWPGIVTATAGNTLGGALNWWMGYGAHRLWNARSAQAPSAKAQRWLKRYGAKACVLSWLPLIGDALCVLAGWLRLPFLPCLAYMVLGKGLRYVVLVWSLYPVFPGR
jgi:membrane protein YqaA with SNARE-associated domain